jgi:hypothetical protein
LTEVRLAHGLPELLLTDKTSPATRAPAYITNDDGLLTIIEGTGDSQFYLDAATTTTTGAGVQTIGNFAIDAETVSANVQDNILLSSGADIAVQATSTVDITAPSGAYITVDGSSLGVLNVANVQTTGDLRLLVPGGDVFLHDTAGSNPRLLFRNSSNTFLGGIQMQGANVFRFFNGDVTNDYAYIYAERFYPMNGTTASRYIYDDGTRTHMTGGLDTDGSIVTNGSILNDNISTTTATANAAIWVLSSGTAYTLRRNSSSARYKTNIVDADEAVLEAARKIKPRHYESTIADEAGTTRLGFIAEEVEAAGLTHAVGYDGEGRVETIDATALIAALYARVNDLEERLAALESR